MASDGVSQTPPIGVPLDDIRSPFPLPDFQIQDSIDAFPEPSSSSLRALPANQRKVQFTEEEVERRLLRAVSEAPTDTR